MPSVRAASEQKTRVKLLTPLASCPSCKLLLLKEEQRQAAIFSSGKEPSQLLKSYRLDKVLNFPDARQDLDFSTADEETVRSFMLPFQMTELEMELLLTGGFLGIPMSAASPVPTIGVLIHALPDIIQKVASTKDLTVPEPSGPLTPDDLA